MAETPRYYRVSPKFWSSAERLGWDEETRLLALYILTCEHRTTEGLFRLPKQYIMADLEWSPQRLAQPFDRLCSEGFIEYDHKAKVVLIVKALAYQSPSNPNGVTAALRALEMVPETGLDQRFYEQCQLYCQRLAQQLPERFKQPLRHPPALAPAPAPPPKTLAPDKPPRKVRKADPVWDAVIESCGYDPKAMTTSARGAINKAVADIKAVGATPEQVAAKARAYVKLWPTTSLTAPALAKHWAQLGEHAGKPPRADVCPQCDRDLDGPSHDELCDIFAGKEVV